MALRGRQVRRLGAELLLELPIGEAGLNPAGYTRAASSRIASLRIASLRIALLGTGSFRRGCEHTFDGTGGL